MTDTKRPTVEEVARELAEAFEPGAWDFDDIARFVLRFAASRAREALERAAKECERLFLDQFGKTHEPIACAEAIRRLAAEVTDADA